MNARTRFLLATAVMSPTTGPFLLTVLVVYLDMPPADRDNALRLLLPHLPGAPYSPWVAFCSACWSCGDCSANTSKDCSRWPSSCA